jgi:UDP-galactopyranose mutase
VPSTYHFLIVGAGFSGAVLARELASQGHCKILVIDERKHVAGNCHTERDSATGIMIHVYGPHIFNTNNLRVWEYVNRFDRFRPFLNRVKACTSRGIFSLPINLHTINQFFGKTFNPAEAKSFIESLGDKTIVEPRNFEEQALKTFGRDLYETFFAGYTRKQWGCEPVELPASILKRLPIRFSYDDNYYDTKYQGIPEQGYTAVIQGLLNHPSIEVQTGKLYRRSEETRRFDHIFYTGSLDAYFDYSLGRLSYRTATFERIDANGDYQGNPVINYPSISVPWTRIHEHKHFAPWEEHELTVAFREYSRETGKTDLPFYPKRLAPDRKLLLEYRALAEGLEGISFLGRLATYRYMDMEKVVQEALEFSKLFLENLRRGIPSPVFPNVEPLS